MTDTLLADLQSTSTGLKRHYMVTVDGRSDVVVDSDTHLASRISTDSMDAGEEVSGTVRFVSVRSVTVRFI